MDAPGAMGRDVYLVDGFNLLHAVLLKGKDRATWWSAAEQERVVRLCETLVSGGASFGCTPPAEVRLVFDAASERSERFSGPTSLAVAFAPSADDYVVAEVRRLKALVPSPRVVVVSSDRQLQDRCRSLGAERLSPRLFATTGVGFQVG